jgi:uncharacterized protein (TIGR02001 family)
VGRKRTRGLILGISLTVLALPAWAQQEQEPGGEAERLGTAEEVKAEDAEAAAAEKKSWLPAGVSGNVAVYSDYSFRGISQTNREMALQGGIDFNHDSGLFAGLWGSSTNFDQTYLEQDFYGGYAGAIGDFSYKASATFFFYPNDQKYNYWEFGAFTGYDFKVLSTSLGFIGSPDYFGVGLGTGLYIPFGFAVPLPTISCPIPNGENCISPSFDANGGYTHVEHPFVGNGSTHHYWDWNAGLVLAVPFNMKFDFRYVGTDVEDVFGPIAGDRYIFGAKYLF